MDCLGDADCALHTTIFNFPGAQLQDTAEALRHIEGGMRWANW